MSKIRLGFYKGKFTNNLKKVQEKKEEEKNYVFDTRDVSPVASHLSPVTNANSQSHGPSPDNSPSTPNRMVCKDPKIHLVLRAIFDYF